MTRCACGSGKDFADCCAPFISGEQLPQTPEALMRSRYTAYTKANVEYIASTMQSPASDDFDIEDARRWAKEVKWQKLVIANSSIDGNKGIVEFIAHFVYRNEEQMIHEVSEFHFKNNRWYYVEGLAPDNHQPYVTASKPGRNDPCPCGSGKKFKKCCA